MAATFMQTSRARGGDRHLAGFWTLAPGMILSCQRTPAARPLPLGNGRAGGTGAGRCWRRRWLPGPWPPALHGPLPVRAPALRRCPVWHWWSPQRPLGWPPRSSGRARSRPLGAGCCRRVGHGGDPEPPAVAEMGRRARPGATREPGQRRPPRHRADRCLGCRYQGLPGQGRGSAAPRPGGGRAPFDRRCPLGGRGRLRHARCDGAACDSPSLPGAPPTWAELRRSEGRAGSTPGEAPQAGEPAAALYGRPQGAGPGGAHPRPVCQPPLSWDSSGLRAASLLGERHGAAHGGRLQGR